LFLHSNFWENQGGLASEGFGFRLCQFLNEEGNGQPGFPAIHPTRHDPSRQPFPHALLPAKIAEVLQKMGSQEGQVGVRVGHEEFGRQVSSPPNCFL